MMRISGHPPNATPPRTKVLIRPLLRENQWFIVPDHKAGYFLMETRHFPLGSYDHRDLVMPQNPTVELTTLGPSFGVAQARIEIGQDLDELKPWPWSL